MTKRRNDETAEGKKTFCDVRCAMCELRNTQHATRNTNGFTLVELIVSITITAIIMVGVSAFFASSFHNIFVTQEKLDESQGQFATNEIIRDKLADIDRIINNDTDNIVVLNKITKNQKPFTYIGNIGGKLVFKDFFVFNGMVASEESKDFADNAGGITKVGTNYYVVLPLENKIIICISTVSCTGEITGDFDHPTDITTDGTDLFVSDSGNNRVIKMTTGGATIFETMADGLNFPTGLAFSNNYLYVSDTYNNRVVKFRTNLGTYPVNTSQLAIAGDSTDDTCDNSAKLCKLNFPTGLVVSDDGKSLYISDTGSGRILKITDPESDLNNHEINISLTSQKISKINFIFPSGTDVSEISENSNTLHKGKYSPSGSTLGYYLSVPMVNGDATLEDCNVDQGDPCIYSFQRFTVSESNDIFEYSNVYSNDIKIINPFTSTPYIYTLIDSVHAGTPPAIFINVPSGGNPPLAPPGPKYSTSYPSGTMVSINREFDGDFIFDFDLSGASISSGFSLIKTEVYDDNGVIVDSATTKQILRVGDGIIGTAEDTIEEAETALDYPTGLGWDGGLQIVNLPVYDEGNFPEYDYESDFGLTSLQFSEPNVGKLMQVDIEAENGDEYIINAALN